jgi:hypothetical protein
VDAAQLSTRPAPEADAVAVREGASKMPAAFSWKDITCTQAALRCASARVSSSSCARPGAAGEAVWPQRWSGHENFDPEILARARLRQLLRAPGRRRSGRPATEILTNID